MSDNIHDMTYDEWAATAKEATEREMGIAGFPPRFVLRGVIYEMEEIFFGQDELVNAALYRDEQGRAWKVHV